MAAGQPEYSNRSDRHSRWDQLLALVGIAAGVVFVVAVIFFSGFWLARASDGGYGISSGGRDGTCPMMQSGRNMGPGMMGPGASVDPGHTVAPAPQPMPRP
ncbi:hypothetical protein JPH1_14000 [Mycobacterium avium subsp. hominissuis]|uniref:Uncharacterized protein n=1 Tax=Mycobacterium avium subsp. hominissuis TaxID=439334 RepID=A0AAI8SK33_MYCAV|nr:hypothetical protein JPH1_14000 [Mycobacterium avium subsp. hominissuis]